MKYISILVIGFLMTACASKTMLTKESVHKYDRTVDFVLNSGKPVGTKVEWWNEKEQERGYVKVLADRPGNHFCRLLSITTINGQHQHHKLEWACTRDQGKTWVFYPKV